MNTETLNSGNATDELVPIASLPSGGFADGHRQKLSVAAEYSEALVGGQFVPKGLSTKQDVVGAIALGLSLGIDPLQALQSVAVINGRPAIYGDTALGLVRGSGKLEWITETFEGEPGTDERRAVCTAKRTTDPEPIVSEFSVGDAKRAGLWGKQGPWTQYPQRMLKFRARGFALRDGFGDVLRGLATVEEVSDIPAERNVTPAKKPIFAKPEPNPEPEKVEFQLEEGAETPTEKLKRLLAGAEIAESSLIAFLKTEGMLPEEHTAKYVSQIGDKRTATVLEEWDVISEAIGGGAE